MLGAIAGDIAGSVHEGVGTKTKDFELFGRYHRFTDDTVLTVAVADWILHGGDLVDRFHQYFDWYTDAGFGAFFFEWASERRREPYNSWGNGSAMRVSPIGFAFNSIDEVREQARRSAEVTHNHPEGVRGAEAAAAAVFLARTTRDKTAIRLYVEQNFGYDLSDSLQAIRPTYHLDGSCQGSVPQSIVAFLEAEGFEDAVRNAISLGGDADTMACIAGGIAEAFHGVPAAIERETMLRLSSGLTPVVRKFRSRYCAASNQGNTC
ncbi:MAG: ADP-ribosylglycohydrolase family protein [Planctomycetia bacterium]|nr:ADP-ribosylglycohydrolase family protein [Planctomycetia bacterium]